MIPVVRYREGSAHLKRILNRQATFDPEIDRTVAQVLAHVAAEGDAAVLEFSERFDRVRPASLLVPQDQLRAAADALNPELRQTISRAADNIRRFHERQRRQSWFTEDGEGVILGQRIVPLERVGLYVPGGTAFYPSSLLMNAIPAQVAGVPEIVVVSPPKEDGLPTPDVMATAYLLGLTHVYAVGGAQAIAALAYGTETIGAVDKITGPGNAYVASAKRQVFGRVAIDSIAGPSEVVVLADETADPTFIAADLLAQAEHDVRASAVLVTHIPGLAERVNTCLAAMTATLPRSEIIVEALKQYGAAVVTDSTEESIAVVNLLAPEHLELLVGRPWEVMPRIKHAGAIFMGAFSPEPVGDYFAGPNHVLPTGGTARYASALGVDDFVRSQSIISYTSEKLAGTGVDIMRFADAEGLQAHALSVRVRMDVLNKMSEGE